MPIITDDTIIYPNGKGVTECVGDVWQWTEGIQAAYEGLILRHARTELSRDGDRPTTTKKEKKRPKVKFCK